MLRCVTVLVDAAPALRLPTWSSSQGPGLCRGAIGTCHPGLWKDRPASLLPSLWVFDNLPARCPSQSSAAYSGAQIMAGLREVAIEVAKKKISSEEETWSDQSVLIFYNNLEVGRGDVVPGPLQLCKCLPM